LSPVFPVIQLGVLVARSLIRFTREITIKRAFELTVCIDRDAEPCAGCCYERRNTGSNKLFDGTNS
jgi:hypothetical protein